MFKLSGTLEGQSHDKTVSTRMLHKSIQHPHCNNMQQQYFNTVARKGCLQMSLMLDLSFQDTNVVFRVEQLLLFDGRWSLMLFIHCSSVVSGATQP